MTIVTVAKALRSKSESVWEATLEKLKKEELVGVQTSMDISMKMSYRHLENEEINFNMHDMVCDAALSIAHKDHNFFTLRIGKLDDWLELEKCTSISICNNDIIDGLPEVINCPQLKLFQIDTNDPSLEISESFYRRMKNLRVLILIGFHLSSLPYSIQCLLNLRILCLERCTLDCNLSILGKLKKLRILSFFGPQLKNLPTKLQSLNKLRLLDISDCFELKIIPSNLIPSLTCLEELYIRESLIKMLVERETNKGKDLFLSKLENLHKLKVVDLSVPSVSVFPNHLFFHKLKDYKIVIGDFELFSVGEFRMPDKYETFRVLALQLKDDIDIHSQENIKFLFKTVQSFKEEESCWSHLTELETTNRDHKETTSEEDEQSEKTPPLFDDMHEELEATTNIPRQQRLGMVLQLKELVLLYSDIKDLELGRVLAGVPALRRLELLSLEEQIVSNEGSEEGKVMKIVFSKLITVELVGLEKMRSFCSHKECEFEFPSLEIVIVRECPKMEKFSERESIAPKLKNVFGVEGDQKAKWQWEGHLNATIQKVFNHKQLWHGPHSVQQNSLGYLKRLCVIEHDTLEHVIPSHLLSCFYNLEELEEGTLNLSQRDIQELYLGSRPIPNSSFNLLNFLTVDDCQFLSDVILPLYLLPFLTNLETLKVRNCDSVKAIFDVKCTTEGRDMTFMGETLPFSLKKLTLSQLPNLENVWNGDPHGVLSMRHLQEVHVEKCKGVTSLFPASIAKDLKELKKLVVENCEGLMTIVAEDNIDPSLEHTFPCPRVRSLKLQGLSKLKYFYYCSLKSDIYTHLESHTMEQLELKVLHLESLKNLIFIGLENSWTDPFVKSLETFEVISCSNLERLRRLRRFYKGSLSFPSLEELSVKDCDEMVTLCAGTVETDKLSEVRINYDETIPLKIDLNLTMRKNFLEKTVSSWQWKWSLELRDRADLQEIWGVSVQIPDLCFSYLETLIVEQCHFSSYALPFTLLPLLPKLETLEDLATGRMIGSVTSPLKTLVLWKLPNLESVWNEDPVEIVTEANPADPKETNPKLTFPTLTSLTLWDLPKFKHNTIHSIHHATTKLITPNLEHLTVDENELKMIVDGKF
ncbi:hypothetical protein VNO80_00696 [Phaseolus coccineus]|uniref:Disease resistance protein At4g27190-like leucine-rich repeats domain-containing protein n=1 Tax=Phaseolus coccineus TaxID=3886 RepID=A0AAN9P308_PHACN